jgi:hypothetical protein
VRSLSGSNAAMAGRRPHHGPAFGTGEPREEGNTLLNGGFTPGRTTATPPRIRVPALFYSAATRRKINREGFITAPFGTTPWVANRQRRSTGLTVRCERMRVAIAERQDEAVIVA